ncbi:hypothetical protein A3J78_02180 [Candidatus Beckwithbacteria bacterium RBG_13_35_6]|uniref:DUF5666 domain-containing protein n=1 Tax=Candidatus Beckwithbacteria bacterium RBG_13_35_6 TaxID=1797456 RepID=A0A1F5DHK7_9BACT|nr:MAG: hypothetical protein A3J78_02180 [Candidatus Beckwithbacteria bacterium RBG_13_35_6]
MGLVGGLLYFRQQTQKLQNLDTSQPLTLGLQTPYDGLILNSNVLTVKGTTLPNSVVVFYTETDENSVESDANGNFAGTINLQGGINTLVVTAFSEIGEEKTQVVDVVYEEAEQADNTPSESSVQGVQIAKKPENNPASTKKQDKQAIVGNIDEVTTDSLIVIDKKGKIKVKTNLDQETPIIGQDKNQLKIKDLKTKDRTAIVTEEGIATKSPRLKKALKVYQKEATYSAQLKRRAVQGIIIILNKPLITLAHQTQRERHFNILTNDDTEYKVKNVAISSFADLKLGDRIMAVGDIDEIGNITAKRIHLIPGKAIGIFKKLPVATESAQLSPSPISTVSASPSPLASASATPSPSILPVSPSPLASEF